MDSEVEDMHVCLKCNSCIVGLEEYVLHRKTDCPGYAPVKDQSSPASSPTKPSLSISPIKSPTSMKTSEIKKGESLQQHLINQGQSLPQPKSQTQQQEENFTCPGCKRLFDVELAYLAHVRACSHIEWPNSEGTHATTSEDNAEAGTNSEGGDLEDNFGDRESKVKVQHKNCGKDLDFRNLQADNCYHCLLCEFKTLSKELIRAHVRSKEHTEELHTYVEENLGKTFNFFEKNANNFLYCDLCGWQAQYRAEMEFHLCQRVHHENIMRLVDPEYSIFGRGTIETYNKTPKGILDLKTDDVDDLNLSQGKFITRGKGDVKDVVDEMLFECLRKRIHDNKFYCKVCDYITNRKNDMRLHMVRKKHKFRVDRLKTHLTNNGGTLDIDVFKSIQQGSWVETESVSNSESGADKSRSGVEQIGADVKQSIENAEQSGLGAEQPEDDVEQSKSDAEQSGLGADQPGIGAEQPEVGMEQSRSDAEQSGLGAEQPEVDMEQSKSDAEQSGLVAEQPEVDMEQSKSDAEQSGLGAEQSGLGTEQPGIDVEQSRSENVEQSGFDAEQAEVDMEQSRSDAEQSGLGAEQSGIDVEQSGIVVEHSRSDVDHSRVNAEKTGFDVEQSNVNAEQIRRGADQPEVEVEQGCAGQSDIGTEESSIDAVQSRVNDEACSDENDSVKATRTAENKFKLKVKPLFNKTPDKSDISTLSSSRRSLRKRKATFRYIDGSEVNTDEDDDDVVEITEELLEDANSVADTIDLSIEEDDSTQPSSSARRGLRKRKANFKYVDGSEVNTDEDGDDIIEIPINAELQDQAKSAGKSTKKGRGRPRIVTQSPGQVNKRGGGRPRSNMQPATETTISGRGRPRKARPRKAIQYIDESDEDQEIEESNPSESSKNEESYTSGGIKQGRGRPSVKTLHYRGAYDKPRRLQMMTESNVAAESNHPEIDYEDVEEEEESEVKSVRRGRGRTTKESTAEILLSESKQKPGKGRRKRGRGRPRLDSSPPGEIWEAKNLEESKLFSTEFCCELCKIGFNVQKPLHRHVRDKKHLAELTKAKKQKKTIIKCKDCPSIFLFNDSFDNHCERHEMNQAVKNTKAFHCDACVFSFLSEDMLIRHKETNCKSGDESDNIKKENIDDAENLDDDGDKDYDLEEEEEELKKDKPPSKRRVYVCEICDVMLKTKNSLSAHFETMTHEAKLCEEQGKEKKFRCEVCWEKFPTVRLLDGHLEKHTQNQQNYKICAFCNEKVLRDQYKEHCQQEGHEEIKQPTKMSGFRCDVCDKVMMTSASLADHKYMHTGQRPHKCPMCPFRARRKGDISIHVKRHLGITPYKCDQCDIAFVKKSSLARHKACRHNPNRTRDIKCNLCDETFYSRSLIRIHRRNKHEENVPMISCQEKGCTHMCREESQMRVHMQSHTKEKPWLCTTCGKALSSRKALVTHQRIHTGERPFKCTYEGCKYAARFGTHLRRHVLIHTGEKPYKCPHCAYRANTQENLRKHVKNSRKHKGMKMYKCSRCNEWEGDTMKEMVNHIRTDHGVYVKRLEVANETGIFQKNTLAQPVESVAAKITEGGADETASSSSTEMDMVNFHMMEGDGQNNDGNYEQHVDNEGVVTYEQSNNMVQIMEEETLPAEQSVGVQVGQSVTMQMPPTEQNMRVQMPSTGQSIRVQVPPSGQSIRMLLPPEGQSMSMQIPPTGQGLRMQVPPTGQSVLVPVDGQLMQVPPTGESVLVPVDGQLMISATLQPPQERQIGQLVVRLEERVGDIFNSLMQGGLG